MGKNKDNKYSTLLGSLMDENSNDYQIEEKTLSKEELKTKRKSQVLKQSNHTVNNENNSTSTFSITKIETRSKRITFLAQPSICNTVQTKCKNINISMSELLNQFLIKVANEDLEVVFEDFK